MSTFNIDFFELSFLAEACIPPVPIARNCFWKNLTNKYYKEMSQSERNRLFEWIVRSPRFDIEQSECKLFYNRFNPDNQYLVTTNVNSELSDIETFLYRDEYHVKENQYIQNEFIVKIEKINTDADE